ncbi:MAG: alpha/beta hydrolase [archaeon]|nr:alpha/beta hydrolase [archaeon]
MQTGGPSSSPPECRWKKALVVENDLVHRWYPTAEDGFLEPPADEDEHEALQRVLTSLPDGSTLPCRGRDRIGLGGKSFTEWSYGVCIKYTMEESDSSEKGGIERERDQAREQQSNSQGGAKEKAPLLFFLWDNGRTERYGLDVVNFVDLVQFVDPDNRAPVSLPFSSPSSSSSSSLSDKVVIFAHGWSPSVGPNYPLIRTLQHVAAAAGWRTIVPSFVGSYRMGSQRSRAERVATVFEELLCLEPRPSIVALVGHSQGGAAVALACVPRVVEACRVRGLLLVGSESPLEMDGMQWAPRVPVSRIVHADKDAVVSSNMMRQVSQRWGVPLLLLDSGLSSYAAHYNDDDIAHDFMTKILIEQLVPIFISFLSDCQLPSTGSEPQSSSS